MMFNRAAPLPAEENETGKTKKMIQTPRCALGDKENSVLLDEKIAYSTRKGLRPSHDPVTPGQKNQILVFEDDVKAEESAIPTKNVDKVEEEKEDVNEESWMDREEIETFGRAPFACGRDTTFLASNTFLMEPPTVMDNDTREDEEVVEEEDWELAIERATCDHDHGHVYDDVVACYPFEVENVILTENSNDDDENDTAYASIESDTEGEQGVNDAKEEYTHERFLQEYHDFFKRLGHEPQGFEGLHL